MTRLRLARDAERGAGDPVTTVAALEGPDDGHFLLATPVPHPFAWGRPDGPLERLTGLDTDTIWDVLTCKRLVVLGGCDRPVGTVIDEAETYDWPAETQLATGADAIGALLALDEHGDRALRVAYVLAGLEPTDLMIAALPVPPGTLWLTDYPTIRDLYLRVFDVSMRVTHRRRHAAPVMIMRHELAELSRVVGFLFTNGDRGLYTTRGNLRCASLRDILQAVAPVVDVARIMAGEVVEVEPLSAVQVAALRAAGIAVDDA